MWRAERTPGWCSGGGTEGFRRDTLWSRPLPVACQRDGPWREFCARAVVRTVPLAALCVAALSFALRIVEPGDHASNLAARGCYRLAPASSTGRHGPAGLPLSCRGSYAAIAGVAPPRDAAGRIEAPPRTVGVARGIEQRGCNGSPAPPMDSPPPLRWPGSSWQRGRRARIGCQAFLDLPRTRGQAGHCLGPGARSPDSGWRVALPERFPPGSVVPHESPVLGDGRGA